MEISSRSEPDYLQFGWIVSQAFGCAPIIDMDMLEHVHMRQYSKIVFQHKSLFDRLQKKSPDSFL